MDIRNVQRTGNMFYLYLPTSWCKKFRISSDSKLQVETTSEGKLLLSSTLEERKLKRLEITVDETDLEIINKLIVACYINPASSFRIHLKEDLDQTKLLDQKKLVSIELVEIEGKTITCESSVSIAEPELLLKTIINKVKNMLIVMTQNYNKELVARYEEEIDRNRLLIDKSIINALTYSRPGKVRTIDLYYISQIARELEHLADHLILIDVKDKRFFEEIQERIDSLKQLIDMIYQKRSFNYKEAIKFARQVIRIREPRISDLESYYKSQVKEALKIVSEVMIDWAITDEMSD